MTQNENEVNPNDIVIGVVVPCYNHGEYLKESVESIFNQTHQNIRVIIVNDGSTDNTAEVARELVASDDRAGYIELAENRGKWCAMNQAIARMDCVFVTTQDADDVSTPDRLERQLQCLLQTNTSHNLCGFYNCENEDDINVHRLKRKEGELPIMPLDEVLKHVLTGMHSPGINHYYTGEFETAGASAMFHKNIWNFGTRFNPPGIGLRVLNSEDSDFNFRVTFNTTRTSVLLEKLYCYRRNTSTNNEEI